MKNFNHSLKPLTLRGLGGGQKWPGARFFVIKSLGGVVWYWPSMTFPNFLGCFGGYMQNFPKLASFGQNDPKWLGSFLTPPQTLRSSNFPHLRWHFYNCSSYQICILSLRSICLLSVIVYFRLKLATILAQNKFSEDIYAKMVKLANFFPNYTCEHADCLYQGNTWLVSTKKFHWCT